MFTGLVEAKSQLLSRQPLEGGEKMAFSHEFVELALGESIAISGACLTVVDFDDQRFTVELSRETLGLTTLGDLAEGDWVNLERALQAGARLGGHLVTGHVDGIGKVIRATPEGEMTRVTLEVPKNLARYVARKGSLTVDGVSLTVNEVREDEADLLLIPHTRVVTTLDALRVGSPVNLEVDLVARYVERLLSVRKDD